MLWIGDSTMRQAAATMYNVLNNNNNNNNQVNNNNDNSHVSVRQLDNSSVIDVNKHEHVEDCVTVPYKDCRHTFVDWCRPIIKQKQQHYDKNSSNTIANIHVPPKDNRYFMFTPLACLTDLEDFLLEEVKEQRLTKYVDMMVIGVGLWEASPNTRKECYEKDQKKYAKPRSLNERMSSIFRALVQLQSQKLQIVWRTTGYSASLISYKAIENVNNVAHELMNEIITSKSINNSVTKQQNVVHNINNHAHDTPINFTILEWAAAVKPRLFGEDRIKGDIHPHYGLEARLVMMQMLTNLWVELPT